MRRMSNFDEESEYQDFTEMQNRYDADRSRESRNFRYRNDETYDRCAVPRNHRAYDRPFYNFSSEVPHTSHDRVTDMYGMFEECELPKDFTLGEHFDTSNVTDMSDMFSYCSLSYGFSLGEHFTTSNVTSMVGMFYACKLPEGFSLGEHFDTSILIQ